MAKAGRIVVGIDGSDCAAAALDWAIAEAALRAVPLDIVHGWTPGMVITGAGLPGRQDPALAAAAAKELVEDVTDQALQRASSRPDVVNQVLHQGAPSTVLLEASEGAAELVVGSHGLGFLTGAVLGSVSNRCAAHATVPVTVIPHLRHGTRGDGRVVVGVDRSECAYAALRWAVDAAGRRHAPLVVVHSYRVPWAVGGLSTAERSRVFGENVDDCRSMLLELTDGVVGRAERAPERIELLPLGGSAGDALVNVAEDASLLVIGACGRRGLERLLGSVSRHVLHHLPCPTTVVKEV